VRAGRLETATRMDANYRSPHIKRRPQEPKVTKMNEGVRGFLALFPPRFSGRDMPEKR